MDIKELIDKLNRDVDEKRLNVPRDELVAQVNEFLKNYPGAKVHLKVTCTRCGERVFFETANMIYDNFECAACGLDQPFTAGGFAADIPLG